MNTYRKHETAKVECVDTVKFSGPSEAEMLPSRGILRAKSYGCQASFPVMNGGKLRSQLDKPRCGSAGTGSASWCYAAGCGDE